MNLLLFIQHHGKRFLTAGFLLCIVLSVFLCFSIYRDTFPRVQRDHVMITAHQPTYDVSDIRDYITIPIEIQLGEIRGIKDILTHSSNGYAEIEVRLDESRKRKEIIADLQSLVYIPNALTEIDNIAGFQRPVINCTFSSGRMSNQELQESAAAIKLHLESLPMVLQVDSFGLMSDERKKSFIAARFNGRPAVEMLIYKNEQSDILDVSRKLEKEIQNYSGLYYLDYEILNDPEIVATRLNNLFAAGIVSLVALMIIGRFIIGSAAVGAGMILFLSFTLSLSLAGMLGVSINMLSSTFLLVQALPLAAVGIVLSGRVSDVGARGMKETVFPAAAVFFLILAPFVPLLNSSGLMSQVFSHIAQVTIILVFVSAIVFSVFIPALAVFRKNKQAPVVAYYRKLIDGLLKRRKICFLAVLFPVVVTGFSMLNLGSKSFSFFPGSDTINVAVNIAGEPGADIQSTVRQIENRLSGSEHIDHFTTYPGLKGAVSDDFSIYRSDRFAMIHIKFQSVPEAYRIVSDLNRMDFENNISVQADLDRKARRQDIHIGISSEDIKALDTSAADLEDLLSDIEGVENIQIENDLENIIRMNGGRKITVSADFNAASGSLKQELEKLDAFKENHPGILVEMEDDKNEDRTKLLFKGMGIVAGLFFLMHVMATIILRSNLHFLIPVSPFYLFAGAVAFSASFSAISILCVIGLVYVFAIELLSFLQLIKQNDQPQLSAHEVIVRCAYLKFPSSLLICISLISGSFVLYSGDFFLKPLGSVLHGGLVFLFYFSSIALPVIAKFSLNRKKQKLSKKAAKDA